MFVPAKIFQLYSSIDVIILENSSYTYYTQSLLGHSCHYPGCKKVLVLDENMKNRCDVCMACEAGYTVYENLPGTIKTGYA